MTRAQLLEFLRAQSLAVQASVSAAGDPQAALVGIAVTDALEVVFDVLDSTRKVVNLRKNPRMALVIGGWDGSERTVQYEGIADEPVGAELDRLKGLYFAAFPDGHEREQWPGITYVRVRPTWVRYSDFSTRPPLIVEFSAEELSARAAEPFADRQA